MLTQQMPSIPTIPAMNENSLTNDNYAPPPVPVTAQRHMFTPESRRALLREVIRLKPYKNPNMWDSVTHHYGWWCYKNICPARRTVPKDRLRKKVKSIICQYPSPGSAGSRAGSMSPVDQKLQMGLDEDSLPYDAETIDLIEQVVKQYVESVEMVQAKRNSKNIKKRDLSHMELPLLHSHTPAAMSKPRMVLGTPPSSDLNAASPVETLRFRPPITTVPHSLLDNSNRSGPTFSPHSTPLGITDMIENHGQYKRRRLNDDMMPQPYENDTAGMTFGEYTHTTRDPISGSPSTHSDHTTPVGKPTDRILLKDQSHMSEPKRTHSLDELLSHQPSSDQLAFGNATTTPKNDASTTNLAMTVADAASLAILKQVPDVLQSVRKKMHETDKANMEMMMSLGSSLGSSFGESLASTFASAVNGAVEQIITHLEKSNTSTLNSKKEIKNLLPST